jgi:7,8-dihydropterin-6-yl-methyl-4-(beta-D-ribofuranosyl)aminobenzene 5'-phosphate synthase
MARTVCSVHAAPLRCGLRSGSAAGTPLIPQAVLGNPHPPWQPISERDAEHVLEEIEARGPRVIALSGHDSTPWTNDAFSRRFGDRYRTLRVREELRITALGG